MITKKLIVSFLLLSLASSIVAQTRKGFDNHFSIIPQPLILKARAGNFVIGKKTRIYVDHNNTSLRKIGEMLSAQLKLETGYTISINENSGNPANDAIILTGNNAVDTLGTEGYSLSVRPERIIIKSVHSAGVFYGMQTLLQLLPVIPEAKKNSLLIQGVDILDKPRFGWRGMMLDVGRYFYSVDFIKKFIDYLAMHKMNT
ncbi:MAG TPA: glycoside hydrolase family 20 zincin-like fold domain-containing protein, partial [Hanamia sp.]